MINELIVITINGKTLSFKDVENVTYKTNVIEFDYNGVQTGTPGHGIILKESVSMILSK